MEETGGGKEDGVERGEMDEERKLGKKKMRERKKEEGFRLGGRGGREGGRR